MKPSGVWKVWIMAGHFEVFIDRRSYVRFRLMAPDGALLAVSARFSDKKAVATAISDVRACAGMGLIEDHCVAARAAEAIGTPSHPRTRNQLQRTAAKRRAKASFGSGREPGRPDGFAMESEHVGEVLAGLAGHAVSTLSLTSSGVSCGLTLSRPKRTSAFGGSGALVQLLNDLQTGFGEGPGITARTEQATVLVRDLADDYRWPRLARPAASHGIRSVLGVPVPTEDGVSTVLTLCVDRPDAFDYAGICAAQEFAAQASRILRPALRIAELKDTVENLHAALATRTVIDTALGVIMAQNHCGHDAAIAILRGASSSRNVKLRDVAASVLVSVSEEHLPVHFDA
ncbi:ANTAR domain-containing protein [Pseudarthrobacter sp. NPDC092424]|uniref:ANTAR domain-containing protein n=1 Tax=Pseudarthrobacter sp. NPDC092424 TaxID=3364415 RepID=UPI003803530D